MSFNAPKFRTGSTRLGVGQQVAEPRAKALGLFDREDAPLNDGEAKRLVEEEVFRCKNWAGFVSDVRNRVATLEKENEALRASLQEKEMIAVTQAEHIVDQLPGGEAWTPQNGAE